MSKLTCYCKSTFKNVLIDVQYINKSSEPKRESQIMDSNPEPSRQ